MPMLPELLNIIGGTKVFGSSLSHFTTGHTSSPDPTTTTAPANASQA